MRQLASIQRIRALDPIENADAIVRATVLGWQLVVKKEEFQVGDLCVYCEIDCLMPDRPEYEFLKKNGMRIRTIRLRGQISQGLCLPLSILPEKDPITDLSRDYREGSDVTDILEITKYEPPMPASLAGLAKGFFPSFIPKTDETRVQVLQDILDKYVGTTCFVTEKMDGSSVTYFFRNGEFGVCSRSLELVESEENSLWKFARENDLENRLKELGKNLALQGEIIGEGIQSNKYKLRGQTVMFFNVFDIDAFKYVDFQEFMDTIKQLGLTTVPILETDFILTNDIPSLVNKGIGKSVLKNDVHREGIVIRPLTEQRDRDGRVSFKAINPDFLLKFQDA